MFLFTIFWWKCDNKVAGQYHGGNTTAYKILQASTEKRGALHAVLELVYNASVYT